MKKIILAVIFLVGCAPFGGLGIEPTDDRSVTYTPNPTYTVPPPYPTYTAYPTYTVLPATTTLTPVPPTVTPVPTFTPILPTAPLPTFTPIPPSTLVPTATLIPTDTLEPTLTPFPTGTQTPEAATLTAIAENSIFVVVTADKTVLRQIKEYNKKGYPIMRVREPRIRYDLGAIIQVYASGGEDNGPLYRADGADYYYRIFDPDGQEEELYVPAWHVEIVP